MGAVIPTTVSSFHADKAEEEAFCCAGAKAALRIERRKSGEEWKTKDINEIMILKRDDSCGDLIGVIIQSAWVLFCCILNQESIEFDEKIPQTCPD